MRSDFGPLGCSVNAAFHSGTVTECNTESRKRLNRLLPLLLGSGLQVIPININQVCRDVDNVLLMVPRLDDVKLPGDNSVPQR